MKKGILVLFVSLVVSQMAFAADRNINYAEFEKYIGKMMTEFQVPGLAMGVVSKSGPLYMKGFGVRGVNDKLPVTPETQFAIGSTSKAFTATSVGILVDRKMLEWDKPVKANYLPDFQMHDAVATDLVTVRDMLTHRTGLPRHDLVWYGTPFSRDEIYQKVRYLEPTVSFREKAQYQNIMFMVAGLLVGRTAETTWEDFVAENIFDKLEMRNSTFSTHDMQKSADFAIPHTAVNGELREIPFRNLDSVGPAGSINSSVRDMGNWLQMQLNEGEFKGERVISKETLAEIHKPQVVSGIMGFDKLYSELGTETYAMGWFSQPYLHKKLIHHGGGIDGFITFVGILPELDIAFVIVGNSGSLVPYFAAFAYMDLLIKGEIGPWDERLRTLTAPKPPVLVEATTAPLALERYAGTYTHPAYGDITVAKSSGKETLNFAHYVAAFQLGHFQNHSFLELITDGKLNKAAAPVTFELDANLEVSGLRFKADEKAEPILFTRRPSALNFITLEIAPIERSSQSMVENLKRF